MSKYFTKYLPVEGDITNPDMVMFKIDNKWTEPCSFDSFLGPDIQDVMQGKLFLCSRDIKVGDEVIVEPGGINLMLKGFKYEVTEILDHEYEDKPGTIYKIPTIKTIVKPEDTNVNIGFERHWPIENLWKVLGEISSKAVWVKEGDEILPENIVMQTPYLEKNGYEDMPCTGYKIGTFEDIAKSKGDGTEDTKIFFKVKCPCCNTFK